MDCGLLVDLDVRSHTRTVSEVPGRARTGASDHVHEHEGGDAETHQPADTLSKATQRVVSTALTVSVTVSTAAANAMAVRT